MQALAMLAMMVPFFIMRSLIPFAVCSGAFLLTADAALVRSRQADGAVDASDFRRRAYHASALLDGWIYIDGGEFSYSTDRGITYDYSSTLLAIDISEDFTNSSVTIHSSPKPSGVPDLVCGGIWVDESDKIFYTGFAGRPSGFGDGRYYPIGLWSFAPDGAGAGTWTSMNETADTAFATQARPYHGLAASGGGKGFYLGGFMGNISVVNTAQIPIGGLLTFDFASKTLTDSTVVGVSTDGVNQMGDMLYVPNFGPKGIAISIGGDQVGKFVENSDALLSMSTVQILDPATGKWYEQGVTGSIPQERKEFCIAGTASTNRTFEILLYAGWDGNLGERSVDFDDAFVLSLPAFRWFKADYTPLHPRHALTCNHVGGGQILTIGGVDTTQNGPNDLYKDVFNTQDPLRQGLNVFDLSSMGFRGNYVAKPKPYTMNEEIQGYYNTHGRSPPFDNSGLGILFQTETFPTNPDTSSTGSPPTNPSPSPTGAIAGGVVGGIVVLALVGVVIWILLRKKRQQQPLPVDHAGSSAPPEQKEAHSVQPYRHELSQETASTELPAQYRQVYELPAGYHYAEEDERQRQQLRQGRDG